MDDERPNKSGGMAVLLAAALLGFALLAMIGVVGLVAPRLLWDQSVATILVDEGNGPPEEWKGDNPAVSNAGPAEKEADSPKD